MGDSANLEKLWTELDRIQEKIHSIESSMATHYALEERDRKEFLELAKAIHNVHDLLAQGRGMIRVVKIFIAVTSALAGAWAWGKGYISFK